MNRLSVRFTFLLIAISFLLADASFAFTLEETFKKKIDFVPNGYVRVENTNGAIDVIGWDKTAVLIEAEKTVKTSDRSRAERIMEKVEIEISEARDEIYIDTNLPHNSGGLFDWIFGNGVSASVRYKIYVPLECNVSVKTTNGKIYVSDISGQLEVKTTNGKIEVEKVTGDVNAYTTNGSIDVEFVELSKNHDMDFQTTNGKIRVELPVKSACNVSARTTNGSIDTDFPLEVRGKFNSKKLTGSINGGGPLLKFRTTNGNIHIEENNRL